jgi:tetratricopeptide (TPR) repeat protein
MTGVQDAERALERADEAFARFDVDALVAHLSAAVRGFTAAGDRRRAAMACVRLGDVLGNAMGNLTAGRAWFARAARLVNEEPPCIEQGWVAVAPIGCDVGDPAELLASAELALDRARRFGDLNLETKALADGGLALVQAGRIPEGMAMLDEALALACGPMDDLDVGGRSVCSFFTACYYAADFERAGSWAGLLRQHGLIGASPGAPIFLSNHCDAVQATSLCELGRWTDAEEILSRAIADFEAVMPFPSWHPPIVLADLRIRQGRLADAEALLLGKDQAFEALLPTARLHLARGDHALARAVARRGLRALADDRLRAVELLTVLVDAALAAGDLAEAEAVCATLAERSAALEVPTLRARVSAARARVLAAGGELASAIALLEEAVDRLEAPRAPWLRATLLVELARLRERAGDLSTAAVDATAAACALAALDVVVAPDDAALLRRLGGEGGEHARRAGSVGNEAAGGPASLRTVRPAGRGGAPAPAVAVLCPHGKGWRVSVGGTSAVLGATKGLRYLAELVAAPGVERHALDLVDRAEGVDPAGLIDRRALGDAGALLDGTARAAYRHRIEELRGEAEDLTATGAHDRAEAVQAELDALVGQLAHAFGLGGRDRRAASAAERARLNVTRALRTAIAKVAEALPGPGAVLDRRVRTGLYCAYVPDEADEVRWIVQS